MDDEIAESAEKLIFTVIGWRLYIYQDKRRRHRGDMINCLR